MKKIIIAALTIFLIPGGIMTQTWTDPVNISPNLPGLDNQPDLCIDKNGALHCVFTHKLASNWRKIYYTKSTNDGQTWTTPEDISFNSDTILYSPHIVVDSNNRLYVTYDYNTGNPAALLIKLKYFEGGQWSEAFTVSEGMYGSEYNQLLIDKNNRLYVFWIYQTEKTYYRYFENSNWSEIFYPYPGNFYWILSSAVIDDNNNILCVGSFSDPIPPVIVQNTIFFKYDYSNNQWSEKTFISPSTDYGGDGGLDIDFFSTNLPAVTYRQKTYFSGTSSDSTMYTYFDGSSWTEPELVVNDPFEQQIAIDHYNRVHIIDREKLETGTKLVHYQRINDLWQGYIIDEAENLTSFPELSENNGKLYLVYNKSNVPEISDVYITKFNIITGMDSEFKLIVNNFNIYPNPFSIESTIEFDISIKADINISIYSLIGKQIKTIEERKFSAGIHKYKWNGTDKNGKEVNPGTYLIRLQAGRHVISKPVEKMK